MLTTTKMCWASKMAEWVRVAAAKSDHLSATPELVWWKERADGFTLFSDRSDHDADT